MPGVPVHHAAFVKGGSDDLGHTGFVLDHFGRIVVMPGEVIRDGPQVLDPGLVPRTMKHTRLIGRLGRMSGHQIPGQRLGLHGQIPELARIVAAQTLFQPDLVLVPAGADLPAVPPRGAKSDAMSIDHHDVQPLLGGVERRRQAGIACADDGDVRTKTAVQRGTFGGNLRRRGVVARGKRPRPVVSIERVHTFNSRCSRSHGLMTCRNSSYSAFLTIS